MSDDLNLPASLERLEISPERVENIIKTKREDLLFNNNMSPDLETGCDLENLSLKAECPKDNCQCNKKKEKESSKNKEAMLKKPTFKRPILRRSKLNSVVLRSPVLQLCETPHKLHPSKPALGPGPSPSGALGTVPQPPQPPQTPESPSTLTSRPSASSLSSRAESCAVQARRTLPSDDTTIDELASYFDVFVHIPKKMSLMAEMMYT